MKLLNNISKEIDNEMLETIDSRYKEFIGSDILPIISEGYYGTVCSYQLFGKKYALKIFKPTMVEDVIEGDVYDYDYQVLKDIGKSKYFPTLHAYKENEWMIVDWIESTPLKEFSNTELYVLDMFLAFKDSISNGWFPDDVKGNNIVLDNKGQLRIIDVGAFLPVKHGVDYNIYDRVGFVMKNIKVYPSVRDTPPYILNKKD